MRETADVQAEPNQTGQLFIKILLGLLLFTCMGCCGLFGAFSWWFVGATQRYDPAIVYSADTIGFVDVHVTPDDPGVQAFLEHFLRVQQALDEDLPPEVNEYLADPNQSAEGLHAFWPDDMKLAVYPGEDQFAAAFNIPGYGGALQLVTRLAASAETTVYRDQTLLESEGAGTIGFLGATTVLASNIDQATGVIDRIGKMEPLPEALADLGGTVRGDSDMHFAYLMTGNTPASDSFEGVQAVSGHIDLVDADHIAMLFQAHCAGVNPGLCETAVHQAEEMLDDRLPEGLTLSCEASTHDTWAAAHCTIRDISAWVDRVIAEQ